MSSHSFWIRIIEIYFVCNSFWDKFCLLVFIIIIASWGTSLLSKSILLFIFPLHFPVLVVENAHLAFAYGQIMSLFWYTQCINHYSQIYLHFLLLLKLCFSKYVLVYDLWERKGKSIFFPMVGELGVHIFYLTM